MKVKVFVLKDANPHSFPADKFFGMVNLDPNPQTGVDVTVYGGTNIYNGQTIATLNSPGPGDKTPDGLFTHGIAIDERYITVDANNAPSGLGIAVYYAVEVH